MSQIFPEDLWVEGEISNLTRSRAGHVYFDLIEPSHPGTPSAARMGVVLFSQTKQIVNAQLKRQNVGRLIDGMAVRVRAAVDFYTPQGKLQLRMTGIDPRYILATIAAERDALLLRLQTEGLVERNKQLPIPLVPLRVGLVTSAVSAAAGDFLTELNQSGLAFQVTAVDARVQGEFAPGALVGGLKAMFSEEVDIIALIRGGGARGDLAVFDNEHLARTIADSPVPVWTGIGHEIDRRWPTSLPTWRSRHQRRSPRRLRPGSATTSTVSNTIGGQSPHSASPASDVRTTHLTACARRGALAGRESLQLADHLFVSRTEQLPKVADRIVRTATTNLDHLHARLKAADPAVLLARGWSITRTADGSVVRSVNDVDSGDTIITALTDGTIISNVTLTDPIPPSAEPSGDADA